MAFQYHGDQESNDYRTVSELWTGGLTGPLKLVATRGKTGCPSGVGTPAVAENRLVTHQSACRPARPRWPCVT